MRRRGFTLIELMVSVGLFSLIALFLYGGIDQIRVMRLFYADKEEQFIHHEQIRSLLYRDLIHTDTIRIAEGDSEHNILFLESSKHTLYGIARPYIVWLVMRRDNALIRLESAQPVSLPLDPAKLYGIHQDIIATDCMTFRVYASSTGRFAALACGEQEIMLETPR